MSGNEHLSAEDFRASLARDMREEALHRDIADFLARVLVWPTRAGTNNMNPRSAVAGARNKRLGAIKGQPDITIYRTLGRVAHIEVKTLKGRLSPEQREFRQWCQEAGHPHCVARSVADVRDFLETEGIPLDEKAARGLDAGRLLAGMASKRSAAA